MGRTPMSGGTAFRFQASEVADMEKALETSSGATPARSVVEGLADKFTNSTERSGQRPVQWKQVWNWFQNRRHAQKAKIEKSKVVGPGGETPPAPKAATVAGTSTAKKPIDATMDFEAKSARDGAWYDVSAFIDKRKGEASGEPEVKVRFAGFGSEEDEWVNIASAVRQRSLPCETTECVAVLAGDLILCFQEGNEQALYFDADILDVQRRRHDVRGCRCRFWVRYRHDQTEEVVPLRKVCRRPETEQRLQQARDASAANSKLSNKDIAIERMLALNGTPNAASQIPPTTPATPVTPAQPSSAFNATPNLYTGTSNLYNTPVQQGTSTPGLQPMQPISTPDTTSSIHQQAAPPPVAPTHSISVLQVAAVSSSQGPTPSMPIATQSTATQQMSTPTSAQQSLPSIESSIARQLTISAPGQQTPPNSAGVELSASGAAQQELIAGAPVVKPIVSGVSEQPTVASTGVAEPSNLSQPMDNLEISKPSVSVPAVQESTANIGAAETSNLAQSTEVVSLTPAVDPTGPSSAAPVNSSAEVVLPSESSVANAPVEEANSLLGKDLSTVPVDEATRVEAADLSVTPPVSTLAV